MSRDACPGTGAGTSGGQDGVQAAIAALSQGESQIAHAVRLAAVVRHRETESRERVELLRRALTLEPRVARQVALDVADDPDEGVRLAAAGVLASTMGSEDDLSRLLSLVADERLAEHRAHLRATAEAVESPDPDETVSLLLRLVDVEPGRLLVDLETLVPSEMHRPQLIRWINKVWARAADHRQPGRYLDAARVVAGILVDQAVLRTAGAGPDLGPDLGPGLGIDLGVSPDELDQITHGLRERPTALDLVGRKPVVAVLPWVEAYADLHVVDRRGLGAPAPRMAVLGARDIAAATASLRLLVRGWLRAMQP